MYHQNDSLVLLKIMSELYTVKDIANKLGLTFPEVEKMLREEDLGPADRRGLLRYYDKDAVDLLEERVTR